MPSASTSNSDLGDFLRSRRIRLSPDGVGLQHSARRRTPGLRREEVAELAEIGVTWYTWLEQGRTIRASRGALERIAHALQLAPDETAHLLALAGYETVANSPTAEPIVTPGLKSVFDALIDPAFIRGPRWQILAWNDAACVVFGNPYIRPENERNGLFLMFANPSLRRIQVDWELQAREFLAMFRADYDRMLAERESFDDMVTRVSERSPEFRRWWLEHDVHHWRLPSGIYRHPVVGEFCLGRTELSADDSPGVRLVVFPPQPATDSADKVRALVALYRAGRL